jgi:hypothetical protein
MRINSYDGGISHVVSDTDKVEISLRKDSGDYMEGVAIDSIFPDFAKESDPRFVLFFLHQYYDI